MIGAIIGDLAASTWNIDKDLFYKNFIDGDAKLSQYGMFAYEAALAYSNGLRPTRKSLEESFRKDVYLDNPLTRDVAKNGFEGLFFHEHAKFALILMALSGWKSDNLKDAVEVARSYASIFMLEKEEFYAVNILPVLIVALRQGMTKDQALAQLQPLFRETLMAWDKSRPGPLGIIVRAWDAFYRWYDFTSVIHSAVKSPVQAHMTAIIAGALAEAMYGSNYVMLKRKYRQEDAHIPMHEVLSKNSAIKDFPIIHHYDSNKLLFRPKNNCFTNVERHTWVDIPNPYEGNDFNEQAYNCLMKSFEPDWDNRFSIYLDNGRFYVYRSGWILCRFSMQPSAKGYIMTNLQKVDDSDVGNDCYIGLSDAFRSLCCLSKLSKNDSRPFLSPFDFMAVYKGEKENPYKDKPTSWSARMWHGEMMFVTTKQKFADWLDKAEELRSKLSKINTASELKMTDGELAIRLFIETLYRKWCPMEEDFSWIYKQEKNC